MVPIPVGVGLGSEPMSLHPPGRLLRRFAAVVGGGLLLAVVPIPAVTFSTEAVGATEAVPTTAPM